VLVMRTDPKCNDGAAAVILEVEISTRSVLAFLPGDGAVAGNIFIAFIISVLWFEVLLAQVKTGLELFGLMPGLA